MSAARSPARSASAAISPTKITSTACARSRRFLLLLWHGLDAVPPPHPDVQKGEDEEAADHNEGSTNTCDKRCIHSTVSTLLSSRHVCLRSVGSDGTLHGRYTDWGLGLSFFRVFFALYGAQNAILPRFITTDTPQISWHIRASPATGRRTIAADHVDAAHGTVVSTEAGRHAARRSGCLRSPRASRTN